MKPFIFFCCLTLLMIACDSPSESNDNNDNSSIDIQTNIAADSIKETTNKTTPINDNKDIDILTIDKIQKTCLATEDGMTTQGSIRCVNASWRMWDAGLNKHYKAITKDATDVEKKAYLKAQRSWLKYRDAELEFLAHFYNAQDGTIFQQFYASDRKELVKVRTLELIQYGFSMEGGSDDLSNYVNAALKMEEDPTFVTCQEERDYTNLAMRMCASEAAERFQAKIDKNIQALEKIISAKTKIALKKSQVAWSQFVDDEAAIYYAIQEAAGGGSIYPTMAAGSYLTLKQRRYSILLELIEVIKN